MQHQKTLFLSSDIRGLKEIAYEGKVDKLAIESLLDLDLFMNHLQFMKTLESYWQVVS